MGVSGYFQSIADSAPIVVSTIFSVFGSIFFNPYHFSILCSPSYFVNACLSLTISRMGSIVVCLGAVTCSLIYLMVLVLRDGLLLGVITVRYFFLEL